MKMSITAFGTLPSTSRARLLDVVADLEKVFADHKCQGVNFTLGIVPAETTTKGKDNDGHEQAGRSERGQAAADDFADDGEAPAAADEGKPAGRKPRSDAGKPRGKRGAEADGKAAEGPERGAAREAEAGGDGSRRPARGGGEGKRQGDVGERAGEGGGGRTRRADVRDVEAAEVAADEEDWGSADDAGPESEDRTNQSPEGEAPEFDSFEEGEAWWAKTPDKDGWPDNLLPEGELNRGYLSRMMSDHFRANGGKSKAATFDLLMSVTGAEDLNKVHADDFDKLARALARDTAKLRHGVKKPGAK